jgi:hypothetical protein
MVHVVLDNVRLCHQTTRLGLETQARRSLAICDPDAVKVSPSLPRPKEHVQA